MEHSIKLSKPALFLFLYFIIYQKKSLSLFFLQAETEPTQQEENRQAGEEKLQFQNLINYL